GKAPSRIIEPPGRIAAQTKLFPGQGLEPKAAFLRLRSNPIERYISHCVVWVSTSDVRVHTSKPDLAHALLIDIRDIWAFGSTEHTRFVTPINLIKLSPEQRVEGCPLFVQRQRMAGALDALT